MRCSDHFTLRNYKIQVFFLTDFKTRPSISQSWMIKIQTSTIGKGKTRYKHSIMFKNQVTYFPDFAPKYCLFHPVLLPESNTGGCLLSRKKAVKDVKSCVRFGLFVGVILDFYWPRKLDQSKFRITPTKSKTQHVN